MNELEERARRVLDVARSQHNPSAVDAERVLAELKARVLAEPMLIESGSPPLAGKSALGKVLIALGVGGSAGFAAGLFAAQALTPVAPLPPFPPSEPVATQPVAAQPVAAQPSENGAAVVTANEDADLASPQVEALPEPALAMTPASEARPGERRTAAPPHAALPAAPRPGATTGVSPLKAELDGLRRAQELLHEGDAAWALARLDELDRANVTTVLLEERMATRAMAQCMLGRDARAETDELARRFPSSAHLERVRASCAQAAQAGTPAQNRMRVQTEKRGSRHEQ
jgi:hypothetical protein